jgi:hypothetical protein
LGFARQRQATGGEPSELFLELLPLTTVERDERAAGEAEPVNGILGEERNRCTRFLVERRTDHHELAFGPAFHFAPAIRSATPVMAIPTL